LEPAAGPPHFLRLHHQAEIVGGLEEQVHPPATPVGVVGVEVVDGAVVGGAVALEGHGWVGAVGAGVVIGVGDQGRLE